ncbi:hypothetical protein EF847_10330 [Actinobacteria bacterium YIM 96077]|uniref:DUF4352 domain-containing protein n=1 Tax=Phytoactinopolyspora halophila TaxID=1981511 RepID=A0A329QEN5_9ACTN|nr:hypothetical protein [Phytoactinopolyspora halophila]AYY13037.1 hypothetical protein EF847_10330 [Actinobacteria bacterium YIM 96077]RAW09702.1 hypothetical protein DPM12_20295 [Phytoactinopolyspora halophila]
MVPAMVLCRILTAAVAVSILVGCSGGDPGDDRGDGTPTPPVALDVALDAELGVGAPTGPDYPPETSGLVAEYTVTNNADVAVLVVERRPADITPTIGIPLPDTAESSWVYSDDSGRILVTKEIFATAGADTDSGTAYRAPAVRLEPGESVTGRAFALTPLRRIAPDTDVFVVPGASTLPANARSWSFCVQIAPDPGETGAPTMADHTPDRRLVCSTATDLPPDALAGGS